MLIVEIDVAHLEVNERLFTGLPDVFRFSVDGKTVSVEESPEFGTNEDFAPEVWVFEQRPQEPLVFSLIYPVKASAASSANHIKHQLTIGKP